MITKALLQEWQACWPEDKIDEKLGKRKSVSPRQVARDKTISVDDRLWVLCKALWYLDESAARYFAIESAATVTHLAGDEDDQALFSALLNQLCEIEDLPTEQRDAARGAARDAAQGAAWGAHMEASILRALEWLGPLADGWEE